MNEYLQFAQQHAFAMLMTPEEIGVPLDQAYMERVLGWALARPIGTVRYSYAIPDNTALDLLAARAPILEIGAGTGYWAYLLRQRGVDVLAFDAAPPLTDTHSNTYHRNDLAVGTTWVEVLTGGPEQAAEHPERTLFLCWPPPGDPMAADALAAYAGECVVFIGEWNPKTAADEAFFAALEANWAVEEVYEHPRWFGMKDRMSVWLRASAAVE
jgi:hypothetical protein